MTLRALRRVRSYRCPCGTPVSCLVSAPTPGADRGLCVDCEREAILSSDVMTDPDADVRTWRAKQSSIDRLLGTPARTYTPDLEIP